MGGLRQHYEENEQAQFARVDAAVAAAPVTAALAAVAMVAAATLLRYHATFFIVRWLSSHDLMDASWIAIDDLSMVVTLVFNSC